jgi:L-aspartate oxidase
MKTPHTFETIIVGSGIAGLNFALGAAKEGTVLIITKKRTVESSTNRAQGGIAAVLDQTDNIEKHIGDTLEAGAHHNDPKAVEFMVKKSAEAIARLIELGVPFATNEQGELLLTREGGHSERRIGKFGRN